MLIAFICIALGMIAVALAFVVWPLLKPHGQFGEKERRRTNLELLRAQYNELKAEYEAGRIPEDEFEETRAELEARVLEETEQGVTTAGKTGRHGFVAAVMIVIALPISVFLIYNSIGTPVAMDEEFTRQQQQMAIMHGSHSDAELMELIQLLEARLKKNPDNLDGWFMLAKTNAAFKNWSKSSEAFEQVNRLLPGNADVLADWADVMAAANNNNLEGRPEELVKQALKVDPTHWKALALMGTVCFDRKDYQGAVKYWERMRAGVEQGSEEWRQITENIEQARKLGGLPAPMPGAMVPVQKRQISKATFERFVTGRVELSSELAQKVRPDDTVFVFARPISGSKMPVAFMSMKVSDLPATFRLDSSSQMGMGMKTLSDVDEVIVEARISRSGNFMPAPGDMEGAAKGKIAVGSKNVLIRIEQILK